MVELNKTEQLMVDSEETKQPDILRTDAIISPKKEDDR